MSKVYEAPVCPAHGGFGMFDVGERSLIPYIGTEEDWVALANKNGFNVREATEVDGLVYGQNGARIYAVTPHDPATGETDKECQYFMAVFVQAD